MTNNDKPSDNVNRTNGEKEYFNDSLRGNKSDKGANNPYNQIIKFEKKNLKQKWGSYDKTIS